MGRTRREEQRMSAARTARTELRVLILFIVLALAQSISPSSSPPSPPPSPPSSSSSSSSGSSSSDSPSSPPTSTPAPPAQVAASTSTSTRRIPSFVLLASTTAFSMMSSSRTSMAVPAAMLLSMTLFQGAAAQVKEQQTTTVKEGGIAPAKPAVDCQVTWDDLSWTKCSPQGTQSRRYTVDVYPTRAGKQCPAPEVRPCEYAGPQEVSMDWKMQPCAATRRSDRNLLGYTGETPRCFRLCRCASTMPSG